MTRRYELLDAIRIASSLIIVAFHFPGVSFGFHPASGYLAVDMFFMLSGFLVCSVYGERLRQPGAGIRFMADRVHRFWPLHLVASGVGAGLAIGALLVGRHYNGVTNPFTALIAAAAFMPFGSGYVFALNPPAWSLMLEMCVNAVYAATARSVTNQRLIMVVLGLAGLLSAIVLNAGTVDLGASRSTLLAGVVRVAFGFSVGILIARLRLKVAAPKALIGIIPVALAAMLVRPAWGGAYDLLFVLVMAPLTVWTGAISVPELAIASRYSNDTYAVYVLHFPLLALAVHAIEQGIMATPFLVLIVLLAGRANSLTVRRGVATIWSRVRVRAPTPAL